MKPLVAIALFCITGSNVYSQATADQATVRAQSQHFIVHVYHGGPAVGDVLKLCEASRIELQRVWHADNAPTAWSPRCEIFVHASREHYLAAVGQGGGQTRGSSLIQLDNNRVTVRRIDLLMDPQAGLTALPHELTHVVLADRFLGDPPPHWLDEGIAMLADTRHKQMLHYRDCQEALVSRTALSLADLLTLEQFTSAEQMPAFYGQSLSLVQMLSYRGDPQKLVAFGIDARKVGYDRALQEHFAIEGMADLERHWLKHVANLPSMQPPQPVVMVSFQP
ncbi:MAG: hypothetical protein ACO1RT_10600 [Planctomycetaceae bacterium]